MVDPALLARKLKLAAEYLTTLGSIFSGHTDQEIMADFLKYHTAERLFQLIVDELIDINIHLIRAYEIVPPNDFESTFITLGEHGTFPKDFALKIAPVVGLRNLVVHRYEFLQRSKFISDLRKNLSDFKEFFVYIAKLLDK